MLSASGPISDLDHARDAMSPLTDDPSRYEADEVLEAGMREATGERLEHALERGGDILSARAPPSVRFLVHTEAIAGWSVLLALRREAM